MLISPKSGAPALRAMGENVKAIPSHTGAIYGT
jgi:hypothetical protein